MPLTPRRTDVLAANLKSRGKNELNKTTILANAAVG